MRVFQILALMVMVLLCGSVHGETYLYMVDVGANRNGPHQVVRVNEDGTNPVVFISTQLNRPQDVLFLDHRKSAIVSNLATNNITEHDAETGEFLGEFASGIGQPTRMAFGPGGLLYVVQWAGNGRVLRYDSDGNFVDEFTQVGVSQSIGIDWDDDGNMYVASFNAGNIRRFDPDGNDLGVFASAGLVGPTNIWFDDEGVLWALDWSGGAIRRYDDQGNLIDTPVIGLTEPEGVEFLDNGNFLIGHGGTSSVREYDADGAFVGNRVASGTGGLIKPNGLRLRDVSSFAINEGLNDAWFNPDTSGQGVFINVFPVIGKVFIAMFTYDTERPDPSVTATLGEPGHRWFTAIGDYNGASAVLEATLTSGGVFDSSEPEVESDSDYGTVTLDFADCNSLSMTYEFPGLSLSGSIDMRRVVSDNIALCEALNEQ